MLVEHTQESLIDMDDHQKSPEEEKQQKGSPAAINQDKTPNGDDDVQQAASYEGGAQTEKLWYFYTNKNTHYMKFFEEEIDLNLKKSVLYRENMKTWAPEMIELG